MAHDESADAQAHPPAEAPQELLGYTALPNLLLQELGGQNGSTYSVVLFIARHTLGRQIKIGDAFSRVKEVCLSLDEFRHGRRKRDGSRMADTCGLTNDAAVVRGCRAALAHRLLQVVDTGARGVHIYTLADRFWQAAGFSTALKMLADPRVPASFTAYKVIAVGDEQAPLLVPRTDKMSTAAGEQARSSASTAHKMRAVTLQNVSSTAHKIGADLSSQPAQEAARDERKHRNKHRKINIDRSYDTIDMQNAIQKNSENTNTTCSEESLPTQPDLPTSSVALVSRQAPEEGTGGCLYPPPAHASPAGGETAEAAARYQRLLALQRELAQLKKTPSMQLLARQRIPRLEAEVKQLVSALQESV